MISSLKGRFYFLCHSIDTRESHPGDIVKLHYRSQLCVRVSSVIHIRVSLNNRDSEPPICHGLNIFSYRPWRNVFHKTIHVVGFLC